MLDNDESVIYPPLESITFLIDGSGQHYKFNPQQDITPYESVLLNFYISMVVSQNFDTKSLFDFIDKNNLKRHFSLAGSE